MSRAQFDIRDIKVLDPFDVRLERTSWPHLFMALIDMTSEWTWGPGHRNRITVKRFYQCDGASIPFRFYDVVDPITALVGAMRVHDPLYQTQVGQRPSPLVVLEGPLPPVDDLRAFADALLYSFWLDSGMSEEMALRGYRAVRLFGGDAWESEEMDPTDESLSELMMAVESPGLGL